MPVDARPEHRQREYGVRLEWGLEGAELLAAECAVVVIVDVLSFCTAVDVAVGRGAAVLPQLYADRGAAEAQARSLGVQPAGPRSGTGPSLRPSSLVGLPAGTQLGPPSPNGATLCATVAGTGAVLFAGCLPLAAALDTSAVAPRLVDGLLRTG